MPLRRNLGRLLRRRGPPKRASQGGDAGIWNRNLRMDDLLNLGLAFMLGHLAIGAVMDYRGTQDKTHIGGECLLHSKAFLERMKKNDNDHTMCGSYLDAFMDCMSKKPGVGF